MWKALGACVVAIAAVLVFSGQAAAQGKCQKGGSTGGRSASSGMSPGSAYGLTNSYNVPSGSNGYSAQSALQQAYLQQLAMQQAAIQQQRAKMLAEKKAAERVQRNSTARAKREAADEQRRLATQQRKEARDAAEAAAAAKSS